MDASSNDIHNADDGAIDRRTAIKKAALGAATAGVVWTAPRIEGLTLRPNYAAAGSACAGSSAVAVITGASPVSGDLAGCKFDLRATTSPTGLVNSVFHTGDATQINSVTWNGSVITATYPLQVIAGNQWQTVRSFFQAAGGDWTVTVGCA